MPEISEVEVELWLAERRRYSTYGSSWDTTDPKEREQAAAWMVEQFNSFLAWRKAAFLQSQRQFGKQRFTQEHPS